MNNTHTFIRHCIDCGKLFNPTGKCNYICKDCLKVREKRRREKVKQTYLLKNEHI
jgi:predicted nucleic acid-binding Zn ribbon protein